jgi:chromosome segregation ATPase
MMAISESAFSHELCQERRDHLITKINELDKKVSSNLSINSLLSESVKESLSRAVSGVEEDLNRFESRISDLSGDIQQLRNEISKLSNWVQKCDESKLLDIIEDYKELKIKIGIYATIVIGLLTFINIFLAPWLVNKVSLFLG